MVDRAPRLHSWRAVRRCCPVLERATLGRAAAELAGGPPRPEPRAGGAIEGGVSAPRGEDRGHGAPCHGASGRGLPDRGHRARPVLAVPPRRRRGGDPRRPRQLRTSLLLRGPTAGSDDERAPGRALARSACRHRRRDGARPRHLATEPPGGGGGAAKRTRSVAGQDGLKAPTRPVEGPRRVISLATRRDSALAPSSL